MSQTYQPKKRKRLKSHGFLVRQRRPGGKRVITRRRRKGRKSLSVSASR
ncbi:MAG: 50S ribosomal protein L34 [Patescibacteria group bacterium]